MKSYRWHAALERIPHNQKFIVAEIGVWRGDFSASILKHRPGVRMIQVDRWKQYSETEHSQEPQSRMSKYIQETFDSAKRENLKKIAPWADRVKIYEMDSVEAASKFKDGSINLVFLDGSHSYEGLSADIRAWLPKVKKGGWLGGHDYPRPGRPGIKRAVNETFGKRVIPGSDKTWWVRV